MHFIIFCALREKFWRFWSYYCNPLGIDPYLEEVDFQTKTRVATRFEGRVQKGTQGRGKQVQYGKVRAALSGVNAKIALSTRQKILHQLELK